MSETSDQLRALLCEALDLAVRARKLDQAMTISLEPGCPKSATAPLWVIDQYETDLAAWEARARRAVGG